MENSFFGDQNIDAIIRSRYFSDYSYKGTIVEVGGATPEYLSMSRHFKLNGWRAIVIEPNPTFCEAHRKIGNEIYELACSNVDEDNVDFVVVHANSGKVTDHSFSSLKVKDSYRQIANNWVDRLKHTMIKVNVRKLDTIIKDYQIENIDILSVDVEGWELEVMQGLSLIKPKVVILENIFKEESYRQFMSEFGYKFIEKIWDNDIYEKAL
jgi:FkbM family methyltransferase